MFLDKYIDKFMPPDLIKYILLWSHPWQLKFIIKLMDITRAVRYYIHWWSFKGLTNIEWIVEYNISADSFDFSAKKDGISMYARLRNAWDFIMESVESNIDYFDEIVLMENGWSTDDTVGKCILLQKKYPDKIKFFIYKPEVYKLFSNEHRYCPNNSVHNFSYASNYLLSKVSYKYAIKLDDDHLCIPSEVKKITDDIRKKWLNSFLITPLLNVQKENSKFKIAADNYRSTFAWLLWDFGFHPVCHNVYFHSNKYTEWYLHNLWSTIAAITFLHLKLLKNSRWLNNYHINWHTYLKNYYWSKSYLSLPEKYVYLLHYYKIYENR